MSSGNQQLGFAIRAVNEANAALQDVRGDLEGMDKAARELDETMFDLNDTWAKSPGNVDELAASMDRLNETLDPGGKLQETADGFGNLERTLIGTKDVLGVLGEQFGVNLGPMEEYVGAAADVAGGMEGIIGGGSALAKQLGPLASSIPPLVASTWSHVAALIAQAAAFIAANAPIILIVAGIALLAAGVVLLVKHWDDIEPHLRPVTDFFTGTVVPAANAVWEKGLKPVVDFVANNWPIIASLILLPFAPIILLATDAFGLRTALVGAIQGIIDFIEDGAEWIGHWLNVAGGYFEDFKKMAMGPLNAVIGAIQTLIDLAGKIPSPGGLVSGAGGALNKVNPFKASGGPVIGGTGYIVGEEGPEYFVPGSSGFIVPNHALGGGGVTININAPVYGVDHLVQTLDQALKRAGQGGLVAG